MSTFILDLRKKSTSMEFDFGIYYHKLINLLIRECKMAAKLAGVYK